MINLVHFLRVSLSLSPFIFFSQETSGRTYPLCFHTSSVDRMIDITGLIEVLEYERLAYTQASQYYQKLCNLLFIPSVLCTLLSSILSLVASSVLIPPDNVIYIQIIIGSVGIISSILQSVQTSLSWTARAVAFRSAAREYDHLLVRFRFEETLPDEPDFLPKMEARMLDIRSQCHFMLPSCYLEKKHHVHQQQLAGVAQA